MSEKKAKVGMMKKSARKIDVAREGVNKKAATVDTKRIDAAKADSKKVDVTKTGAKKTSAAKIGVAIAKCLLLAVWTALAVMGAQLAVGYLLIWILGPERLVQPVWMSAYSALGYVAGFLLLWLLTPKLLDLGSWAKRRLFKKAEKTRAETARREVKKVTGEALEKTMENEGSETEEKSEKHKLASREELGLKGLPTWTDLGLAPIGYIVATVAAASLSAVFMNFPWYVSDEEQDLTYSTSIEGMERVMAFLVLAVVAPIAEELIFRGWLYGELRDLLGDKMAKWAAVTISVLIVSLLFALLHGQWNVGITVFAMSVVVCLLREMTGSIYAGIFVHMIRNALAFYMLFVLKV